VNPFDRDIDANISRAEQRSQHIDNAVLNTPRELRQHRAVRRRECQLDARGAVFCDVDA
jgi:hypothetical protein